MKGFSSNPPPVRNVTFSATDGMTFCFWFNVTKPLFGRTIVRYITKDIPTPNDLGISFGTSWLFYISMRDNFGRVGIGKYQLNTWTHFCWVWKSNGQWHSYNNGTLLSTGRLSTGFKGRFPKTSGRVMLGRTHDITEFTGQLAEVNIWNTTLTAKEISSVYNHQPIKENSVVAWDEYKGTANGKDVNEVPSPF